MYLYGTTMSRSCEEADFAAIRPADRPAVIARLRKVLEEAGAAGCYGLVTAEWPGAPGGTRLEGEVSSAHLPYWYLEREFARLAASGARVRVCAGSPATALTDPDLLAAVDESGWDDGRTKLFLFSPQRTDLSADRLSYYTGTPASAFQRYVLLTNYGWHAQAFCTRFPGAIGPDSDSRQMPAWHHVLPGRSGITLINIGVGPSNAKTLTDHLAVLRPDAILMIGHCAGLRPRQEIGDLVLASAFLRDDRVMDEVLPPSVPVTPNLALNLLLQQEIAARGLRVAVGIVCSTGDRNWELQLDRVRARLRCSRAVAVDMESATVAANGFRYRIPTATLLAVSDRPLHGVPKTNGAQRWSASTARWHTGIAVAVIERTRQLYPAGLPPAGIAALAQIGCEAPNGTSADQLTPAAGSSGGLSPLQPASR
jgi:AMP nucleosidase